MRTALQEIDRMLDVLPLAIRSHCGDDLARLRCMAQAGVLNGCANYAAIFWPPFVEHDGCILLSARFAPGAYFEGWLDAMHGDRRAVEAELNQLYVSDLLVWTDSQPDRQQVIWLARSLERLWLAKLKQEFADRWFVVSFPQDAADLGDATITFHQAPDAGVAEPSAAADRGRRWALARRAVSPGGPGG